MPDTCPFCQPDAQRVWMDNATGVVLWCAFPVTQGHSLVVPKRHVASIYDLSPDEEAALWTLVGEARQRLQDQFHPDGFNIGVNDGAAAGQPDDAIGVPKVVAGFLRYQHAVANDQDGAQQVEHLICGDAVVLRKDFLRDNKLVP